MRIERYQETVKMMQKEMFSAGLLSDELHEGVDSLVDDVDVEDETEEKLRRAIEAHKRLFRTTAAEEPAAEAAG